MGVVRNNGSSATTVKGSTGESPLRSILNLMRVVAHTTKRGQGSPTEGVQKRVSKSKNGIVGKQTGKRS